MPNSALEQFIENQPEKKHAYTPITVVPGDGIGPEIVASVLSVMVAAGASITSEMTEMGEKVYLSGNTSGIPEETWASLRHTRVMLKAPITTPQGGGYKSLNVTMRKTLGLYANVRPCRAYAPYIKTRHPKMDVVIIRENEEDLYAGIEHQETPEVVQCLKLITRPGCERIVRYAFEYARQQGRKRITCMTKDNIMKLTDGLFHRVFDEIGAEYPDIEQQHQIVDFGMANFVDKPEQYDVVLLPNLYGDILSDIAAQMTGSVGLGGSVNIGDGGAIFEAIHGSAPDIAGKGIANPSGLLLAAVELLHHIGQSEAAERMHNAWLRTLEDGIHTGDMKSEASKKIVGTAEFTSAIIDRLGQKPQNLSSHSAASAKMNRSPLQLPTITRPSTKPLKELVGVDVFVEWLNSPDALASTLLAAAGEKWKLVMISNRGVKVWPNGHDETFCTDHWRCRFQPSNGGVITHDDINRLMQAITIAKIDFIKTEHLCNFNGKAGYSLSQGQ